MERDDRPRCSLDWTPRRVVGAIAYLASMIALFVAALALAGLGASAIVKAGGWLLSR